MNTMMSHKKKQTLTEKRLLALNQIVDENLLRAKEKKQRVKQKRAFDDLLNSIQ